MITRFLLRILCVSGTGDIVDFEGRRTFLPKLLFVLRENYSESIESFWSKACQPSVEEVGLEATYCESENLPLASLNL